MVNGKSGRRDSDEFQAIKSHLNSLPAPAGDAEDELTNNSCGTLRTADRV